METYILLGICLLVWGVTVVLFKVLMPGNENSFVIGSVCGLLLATAAGGAYFQHLSTW